MRLAKRTPCSSSQVWPSLSAPRLPRRPPAPPCPLCSLPGISYRGGRNSWEFGHSVSIAAGRGFGFSPREEGRDQHGPGIRLVYADILRAPKAPCLHQAPPYSGLPARQGRARASAPARGGPARRRAGHEGEATTSISAHNDKETNSTAKTGERVRAARAAQGTEATSPPDIDREHSTQHAPWGPRMKHGTAAAAQRARGMASKRPAHAQAGCRKPQAGGQRPDS